jgi:ribokinase
MRVLSTGTVMVDILAVGLDAIAGPGSVVYTPREIETRIGGHPIDVAIDLIRMGVDPADVALVAAVGEGTYGAFVRSTVEAYGMTAYLQFVADRDTGKNLVLQVAGEDRRFHIDPGANWVLDPGYVIGVIRNWNPAVVTLRPGYSGIDLNLADVLAATGDAVVLLDVMAPHPSRPAGFLEPALRRADIVHCNELEARTVMGVSSLDEAVRAILSHGVRLVVVTSGDAGASAFTRTHRITQRGYRVDAVDATGCGDAFCAGLALALDQPGVDELGQDPDSVVGLLALAQAVGASAATAVGCVEGVSAPLVERLVADQGADLRVDTTVSKHELA